MATERMSGVVDPEKLYTKQNCIGMDARCLHEHPERTSLIRNRRWQLWQGIQRVSPHTFSLVLDTRGNDFEDAASTNVQDRQ